MRTKSINSCWMTVKMTAEANNFLQQQSPFTIPELPSGKVLKFILLYPWDDPFYIGISALEIFSQCGKRVKVAEISTNATEQYGSLESLLSHETCPSTDAKRMWMCDYRRNVDLPIWIKITLEKDDTIAMIRVWNYCQNRVHALRGVHQMKIEFDDSLIFEGEITCAFSDGNEEKFLGDVSSTILFTTDTNILQDVAENDIFLKEYEITTITDNLDINCDSDESISLPSPSSSLTDSSIQRPRTAANNSRESERITNGELTTFQNNNKSFIENLEEKNILKTKMFHIELCANWGHLNLIGLTEIQFLGKNEESISPEGVTVKLANAELEINNNLSSLINGKALTCHPQDMCLIKYDPSASIASPTISFSFPAEVEITGVSIWNYNASPELASAGVQCAQFYVNGKAIVGTVLLRRAPGYVYFDFVQDVTFDRCHLFRPLTSRPATRSISAFIFQFRLLSTWGDEFYIGLNGIELYNRRNHLIQLRNQNIAAFPESVNILPSVDNDPRSSDKLIDGENDTKRQLILAQHMWLTPMLPNRYARIFVIFDSPTYVSRIKIFNYRKTPQRGVHHISLSADDLIIFSGEVPLSSATETGILEINLREC